MYESYKSQELTNEKIERIIEIYLEIERPLIKPILINTIPTTHFAKYHISLAVKDSSKLRKAMSDKEAGIDTNMNINCPSCGNKFEEVLPLSAGFFRTESD